MTYNEINNEIKRIINKEFKRDFQKFIYECNVRTKYTLASSYIFSDFMAILNKPCYKYINNDGVGNFVSAFEKLKSYELDNGIDLGIVLSSDINTNEFDRVSIILHGKYKNYVNLGQSIYVNIDDDYLFTTIVYRLTEFFEEFFKEARKANLLYEGDWDYNYNYIFRPMMCSVPFENAIVRMSMPEDKKEGEKMVEIKDVKFNGPATVIFWDDGTKTVVKCQGEVFDKEKGLAMAICKKLHTGKGHYYDDFVKYCKEDIKDE